MLLYVPKIQKVSQSSLFQFLAYSWEFLAYSWGVFGLLLWSFWLTLGEFLAYSCHDVTDEIMMTDSLFVF
jgi:hypothetical protein